MIAVVIIHAQAKYQAIAARKQRRARIAAQQGAHIIAAALDIKYARLLQMIRAQPPVAGGGQAGRILRQRTQLGTDMAGEKVVEAMVGFGQIVRHADVAFADKGADQRAGYAPVQQPSRGARKRPRRQRAQQHTAWHRAV